MLIFKNIEKKIQIIISWNLDIDRSIAVQRAYIVQE